MKVLKENDQWILKESSNNVFFVKGRGTLTLWVSYAPNSGTTIMVPNDFKKFITDKRGDSNYDSAVKELKESLASQKPVKTKKDEYNVINIYKVPLYATDRDMKEFDIYYNKYKNRFDTTIEPEKPSGYVYVYVADLIKANTPYTLINFFKNKNEAIGFMG